ncbi:hypothetical protein [Streptomyces sp. NBC_00199]|uniref:hypothetical protein n=1 Tax=Streptomyces sp. NBC_00199 TaxID=2975678 RepID=UPI0022508409|nr:hypothetical protein [Streptomyces sp. NBC_00199]MCX5265698.1 hypothetical protein [Streptomyces sp. NBC_00199]
MPMKVPVTVGVEGMPLSLSCSKALHIVRGVAGSALNAVQPWITAAVEVAGQVAMKRV